MANLKLLKCPVGGKGGNVSEGVEARWDVETYRERDTETFSTFPSPFEFFGVDWFIWCTSLPSRLPRPLCSHIRTKAFGPRLQPRFLQHDMSVASGVKSD